METQELPFTRRSDQIFAAFKKFHRENPQIWELFEQFALTSIGRGRTYYSVEAIFARIRWHVDIETETPDPVKLNNNFAAYYARMFHAKHPDYDGFFRCRKLVTQDRAAAEEDVQVFDFGPPSNEDELIAELRRL